ncbi:hypothetical protein PCC8801_1764 [Rippkaea orientalis PCC 8801]|uniref:Uncharacterized protein n=1 Tax=Rippkaea orientalis (strain PCC 8801 / RF-1) TaxID=41431 RepID=B7JWW1_RIPO1|nr:hypothetical protein [Rippkaea orientalis]ACK65810.1 hypothetical protein PCC8801_1764 [Rippkaea orientalis PCC 8801]
MRVWLTTVTVVFILISLYQWIQGFILPLPLNVLGGAFLAIASNYEKGLGSLLNPQLRITETLETQKSE